METMKTPEEAKISIKIAQQKDLPSLENFLSQTKIDSLFSPKLSDPVRGISIEDRVNKKFNSGIWIIANDENGKILGCTAVVPAKISREIKSSESTSQNLGVSLSEWKVGEIMELSTVATDPDVKSKMKVKGVGEILIKESIRYVSNLKNCGLVTDSWIGGDMDGFITHVLNKLNMRNFDYLVQIFKDVSKRGSDGPLTTVYLIPTCQVDVDYIKELQLDIKKLRGRYNELLIK